MSDSIHVQTTIPKGLDLAILFAMASDILRHLLNQSSNFSLDLKIDEAFNKCDSLLYPGDGIYSVTEHNYINDAILFRYKIDPDWKYESDVPLYDFGLVQVRREGRTLKLLICMALAMAAATMLNVDKILDYHGVWCVSNEYITLDELNNLANKEQLSLDAALLVFYKKLPGFN